FSFDMTAFPNVTASVLEWPLSVVRLQSETKAELIQAANHVFLTWKTYTDASQDIFAETENTPHNTVTPIARKRGQLFELDIVLRNNRTSETYPMGIFHPHEDVHHIKKENIGLIEVMGLAVLPARLKEELREVEEYVLGEKSEVTSYHQTWADELVAANGTIKTRSEATAVVQQALGEKFTRVLEDARVFKQNSAGKQGFHTFIQILQKRMKAIQITTKERFTNWKEFTLANNRGMQVSFLNYGGIITEILVPDTNGTFENVVLGFEDYPDYAVNPAYFGTIIGRVAGRIKGGAFTLDGKH